MGVDRRLGTRDDGSRTACAFGRTPGDEKALDVTTDGGVLAPRESDIQDAKLAWMKVAESVWPLLQGV